MEVRVTGTKEVQELLRRAARSLEKKEVDQIIKSASAPLVKIAKQDAKSVNPKNKTYNLTRSGQSYSLKPGVISRSIKWKRLKSRGSVGIIAPIYTKDRSRDPWFAHFVHEGTAERSYKGMNRGAIRGTSVTPFMEKAGSNSNLEQTRKEIERRMILKLESVGA